MPRPLRASIERRAKKHGESGQDLAFMLRYENVAWFDYGEVRILDRRSYLAGSNSSSAAPMRRSRGRSPTWSRRAPAPTPPRPWAWRSRRGNAAIRSATEQDGIPRPRGPHPLPCAAHDGNAHGACDGRLSERGRRAPSAGGGRGRGHRRPRPSSSTTCAITEWRRSART